MRTKRKIIDAFFNGMTYSGALLAALFLGMILYFIVTNGASRVNFGLISGDYHATHYNARPLTLEFCDCDPPLDLSENYYYSARYGIALYDDTDRAGNIVIKVGYIHDQSPFTELFNTNNINQAVTISEHNILSRIAYQDGPSSLTRNGAMRMIQDLESGLTIRELSFSTVGGGIRGSLVTTLYLIGLTLIMAMPIGIMTAIYLNEFAAQNKITATLRSLIETLTGVPSIIYGLLGITVFVPLTIKLNMANGPNLIAGAMTLSVILLPVIIRTTEEALKSIPRDYRLASLALGANYTQTVWKVILPNAMPGILTATFLAIGRIIGESAALIFVLGTAVKDQIRVGERSTSLAVHIWSMMTDEPANIELSSAVALIILMVVLILNIGVKVTAHQLKKKV